MTKSDEESKGKRRKHKDEDKCRVSKVATEVFEGAGEREGHVSRVVVSVPQL